MRYYDLKRHWTQRIEPHLTDSELNAILVRDFTKYTRGLWGQPFALGQFPVQFGSCDWKWGHRGKQPRYWQHVNYGACHWLVNFNLHLAQLVDPGRPWRIVTSAKHSNVWDGEETLFDLNFLALGVPPDECFALANKRRLKPGDQLTVHLATRAF